MVEGGETPIFKQFFSGWRDEGEQVGLGKVFRQGHLGEFIPIPYMFFIFTVDTVFILSEQRTKVNTRKEQKQKRRRLCWYNFTVSSLKNSPWSGLSCGLGPHQFQKESLDEVVLISDDII